MALIQRLGLKDVYFKQVRFCGRWWCRAATGGAGPLLVVQGRYWWCRAATGGMCLAGITTRQRHAHAAIHTACDPSAATPLLSGIADLVIRAGYAAAPMML